ncbi:hypothetical protein R0381_001775 [Jeongeupia wiesaeckerbachi]|uniref:hypothetical protein n=1 Tax=Jeongeupia wiesaeckerbachi TaxID=3051218 RepID=UPI003D800F70
MMTESPLKKFEKEILEAIGQNCPMPTKQDRQNVLLRLLRWHVPLLGGKAYLADRTEADLAYECLSNLIEYLRLSDLTDEEETLVHQVENNILGKSLKITLAIFGKDELQGRNTRDLRRVRAQAIFESETAELREPEKINSLFDEQKNEITWEAKLATFRAYFPKIPDEEIKEWNSHKSEMEYKRTVKIIDPLLRTAGLLDKKKTGRPRNSKNRPK